MSIIAQELRKDYASITVRGGTKIEFTSANAKAAGSVDAARAAFAALCGKWLGGLVDPRSIYLAINADYSFSALESVSASAPGAPAPLRSVTKDSLGNLHITAFDGTQTAIPLTSLALTSDPAKTLAADIAAAGCGDATAQYSVAATFDKTKALSALTIDDIGVSLTPVAAPVQIGGSL